MRILYVNWAPVRYGATVGGGVNIYTQSIATELSKRNHEIYTISSGFVYDLKCRPFLRRTEKFNAIKNYEIVNSPIIAPAFFNHRSPDLEISCPSVENLFNAFLIKIKPDVIHFQNIEGFSAKCILLAKKQCPRVIYSLHNYHTICSQVGLLYQHKVICHDFQGGKRCLGCFASPSRTMEQRKRRLKNLISQLPMGDVLWAKLLPMASIAKAMVRNAKRLLLQEKPSETRPSDPGKAWGKVYLDRRRKMIEAINKTDLVLAVSTFVGSLFIDMGIDQDLVEVNHIGNRIADFGQCRQPENNTSDKLDAPVKIIFMGIADELKGLPLVLKTLTEMDDSILSKIELYLYAKNITYQSQINVQLANDQNYLKDRLAGLFVFDGYRFEDIPDILSHKDLGIVPPIWYDNAPQVVFEMLAMKVPVLGARIGGIPDFVKPGENGLLFEPGSVEDLKEKLSQLIEFPDQLLRFKRQIQPVKTLAEHAIELEGFYRGEKSGEKK